MVALYGNRFAACFSWDSAPDNGYPSGLLKSLRRGQDKEKMGESAVCRPVHEPH